MKQPYIVDLHRRIVDTVVVWADSKSEAAEFAHHNFVDLMDDFPTESIYETEVVDVEEFCGAFDALNCQGIECIGYPQFGAPWNSVESRGNASCTLVDRLVSKYEHCFPGDSTKNGGGDRL